MPSGNARRIKVNQASKGVSIYEFKFQEYVCDRLQIFLTVDTEISNMIREAKKLAIHLRVFITFTSCTEIHFKN